MPFALLAVEKVKRQLSLRQWGLVVRVTIMTPDTLANYYYQVFSHDGRYEDSSVFVRMCDEAILILFNDFVGCDFE